MLLIQILTSRRAVRIAEGADRKLNSRDPSAKEIKQFDGEQEDQDQHIPTGNVRIAEGRLCYTTRNSLSQMLGSQRKLMQVSPKGAVVPCAFKDIRA